MLVMVMAAIVQKTVMQRSPACSVASRLLNQRSGLGSRNWTALCLDAPRLRRGRSRLVVEANELNKWADRGGMDDSCPDSPFDR